MVILISSILLLTLCIILTVTTDYWSDWHSVWQTGSFVFGIILIVLLIAIPLNHHFGKAEVERYYVLKQTVEKSKGSEFSEIERAALLIEISEYNKDLASVKYWNNTIWDMWFYDGLAELEYLE